MEHKFEIGEVVRFYPCRGVTYDGAIRWSKEAKEEGFVARVTSLPLSSDRPNPSGYSVQRDFTNPADGSRWWDCHWGCCESELEKIAQ